MNPMKAYQLLEIKGWTQGASARNKDGGVTTPFSESAACFCTFGALQAAYGPEFLGPMSKIEKHLNVFVIAPWNDDPARTKEEVIAMLKHLDI